MKHWPHSIRAVPDRRSRFASFAALFLIALHTVAVLLLGSIRERLVGTENGAFLVVCALVAGCCLAVMSAIWVKAALIGDA
jgi:ABC-type siderophore export system fused ATPase/permease subunit